ncbi:PGF-CTERM sorting domain-containing protein [Halobaculum sp. WSA2]|uniref:PGF-CTERM sorting domain-containing protein n=1 Tax=Halobaculum saliterrae TaxID=2073113 RepID=A0A6B0SYT6_9EURY|nr:BGTF surface domain-containing protein [Halobaculum saliterrae]MXR42676.1 PGF-CTERM sorting domain-containing protein [Halobaculum saliterrae]
MLPSIDGRLVVIGVVLLAVSGLAGVAAGASDASLSTVNETVRVHAVEDATIEGATDLDAGETVTIRVQSTGDTSPRFFKSADVGVGENGTFVGEFDLADLSSGATFSVSVTHDGSSIAEADGTVVAADVPVTATPTETSTGTRTETSGPGFGVATAAAALCAGAGLAARRRRHH